MKDPATRGLICRWRIVESELCDRAHRGLCDPAALTITAQGGEIAFRALEAGLEVEQAKEPPNPPTTTRPRSNSPTTTAIKPSSK